LVLWQGIIFPYKGIDLLLNAWQHVEANNDEASLLIVGTGAPEFAEEIRDQISRLGLKRAQLHLRFISTEELVALYRAADIVVYPYRAITTSGALATGLALGKTIIASNLPVFRELLTDRENALLVDPNNSAELAAALLKLSSDSQLRSQLAANVLAMHFGDESWLSIAHRTKNFYCAILSPSV
jgi:glycosyltransferase involved in cell wall biosynthesis